MIKKLPVVLTQHVLGLLAPKDRGSAAKTSKGFNKAFNKTLISSINKNPEIPLKDLGVDLEKIKGLLRTHGNEIKCLNLKGFEINDEDLKELLQFCPDLNQLFINSNRITDKGLAHLAAHKNLQTLNLSGCDKITDEGLAHLAAHKNLQTLDLSWCKITDEGLAHLAAHKNLQTLGLSWCNDNRRGACPPCRP